MLTLLLESPRPDVLEFAAFVWLCVVVLVHIGITVAVAFHARSRATALAPPWLWIVATLVCGPLFGVAYWYVNSSAPVGVPGGRVWRPKKAQRSTSAASGADG